MKKAFRVITIETGIADTARRTAAAGQPDHQIIVANSADAVPCRHCLRSALPGEAMILFSYQSIPTDRPYGESGPIFVHQEPCERYQATETYPEAFRHGRAVRGYNAECEIVAGEVANGDVTAMLESMLSDPAIAFLQVRSLTHGCYTMKVERA